MFFSVKSPMKIAGKTYVPCICYALPEALAATVDKLVTEGRAYKFENKVFFQNGRVIEKQALTKKSELIEEKSKKAKKEKVTVNTSTVEPAKDIPSPEEIADNPEEF